jgi:dTDP-4-amino-4,6-dideoxygalactose transaminase
MPSATCVCRRLRLRPSRSGTCRRARRSRDQLAQFLVEQGIATGLHYPQPPHLSVAYAWLGHREGDFPVAERMAREVLSLPMFPGIGEEQFDRVVGATGRILQPWRLSFGTTPLTG